MPKNKISLSTIKIPLIAKNNEQKEMLRSISGNDVTFVKGCAGTGKTHIAVGYGLKSLLKEDYDQLVFTRPAIEAGGEKLGFLPGNMYEKIDPYMIPIFEILANFISADILSKLLPKQNGNGSSFSIVTSPIRILPLAFMRGVTFNNSFIVADECFTNDTKISVITNKGKVSHRTSLKTIFKNPNKYKIMSLNTESGKIEPKKFSVFCTGRKKTCNIKIYLRSSPITCSLSHPFAIIKDGEIKWEKAKNLSVGDNLLRIKLGENNCSILHKSAWDIILGSLLGDGCLSVNRSRQRSYRFSKTHGLSQYEYMDFCRQVFNGQLLTSLRSGYTGKPLCGFETKSMHVDKSFVKCIFNNNHKKRISSSIYEYITKRTLAMWYMDDGNLQKGRKKPYIRLHTEGFSKKEHLILQDVLHRKFGIKSVIGSYRKYHLLRLDQKNTDKFFDEISGLVYPSMAYKVPSFKFHKFELDNYKYWKAPEMTVSSISEILPGKEKEVYNLEVNGNHNFFANKILVHNCQNATPEQFRMLLTRLGKGSKMVLCGDIEQTDIHSSNGLCDAFSLLEGVENVGFITFTEEAIMRHPIICEIEKRYKSRESSKKKR